MKIIVFLQSLLAICIFSLVSSKNKSLRKKGPAGWMQNCTPSTGCINELICHKGKCRGNTRAICSSKLNCASDNCEIKAGKDEGRCT